MNDDRRSEKKWKVNSMWYRLPYDQNIQLKIAKGPLDRKHYLKINIFCLEQFHLKLLLEIVIKNTESQL